MNYLKNNLFKTSAYILLTFILFALLISKANAEDLKKVTLQLKWRHQFQFAGYYAAIEKNYYRDAGLKVTLREPEIDENPIEKVITGDAEFGIAGADLIIHRDKGAKVVALGVLFQHSPTALIAKKNINTLHDLIGKRISLESSSAELLAMFQNENIDAYSQLEIEPHIYSVDELLSDNVDALSIYTTDEPFMLQQAEVGYHIFSPRAAGIDFYGDTLFTMVETIESSPKMVASFREASFKGWEYALNNQEEIIDLIFTKYSQRHSREHLRFEAQKMNDLIRSELLEIGYMHKGRWQHMIDTYRSVGMLSNDINLDEFIYESEDIDLTKIYTLMAIILGALFLVSFIALLIIRLNSKLKHEIEEKALLEKELRNLAYTDSLSGCANRRALIEQTTAELSRIKRHNDVSVLLICDLDNFKEFNDLYGHLCGDEAIRHFSTTVKSILRPSDVLGRSGGDEFIILLPATNLTGGKNFANRLLNELGQKPFTYDGKNYSLTVSIGLTDICADDSIDDIMLRADEAMYLSKKSGRSTFNTNEKSGKKT